MLASRGVSTPTARQFNGPLSAGGRALLGVPLVRLVFYGVQMTKVEG